MKKPDHEPIKILLVEDSKADALLLKETLGASGTFDFSITSVNKLSEAIKSLSESPFDVVLLDLTLPDNQGISSFAGLHSKAPDVPVVVLTGISDETVAINTVKEGVQDYLVKGKVDSSLLVRSILYAIERKKTENRLKESEMKFRTLFNSASDAIFLCKLDDKELRFVDCNPYSLLLFKCSRDDIIGSTPLDFSPSLQPDDVPSEEKYARKVAAAIDNISQHFVWKHCQHMGLVTQLHKERRMTDGV